VVLPARAAEWTEERRQVVLLHELAHVKRRDLVAHGLGRLACALYWFHPLVWRADRRLRAESERACDDLVLACGARASDYASHLLDILTAARGPGAPATALPMARTKEFEGRLLAILDPLRTRQGPGRLPSAALLAGLAAVFVVVAAAAPTPPTPRDPSPAAPRAPELLPPSASVAVASEKPATATVVVERTRQREEKHERRTEGETERESERDSDRDAEAGQARASAPEPPGLDDERRALVLRALRSDTDPGVRRAAAWALADRTRPDEVGVLVAALRGDADAGVREMAAWALADAHGDDITAALAIALQRDGEAGVRATAAWGLGQRRLADPGPLVAALGDSSPVVQETAIWALGEQRLASAPAPLTAALLSAQHGTRLRAAWALGEILDPATIPALRTAFLKEDDVDARRAMFRALAFLGDRSPELLDRAAKSKDAEIRSRAILMLAGEGPGIWPWPWPWPQPRPMP
jgi:HEAT repeat protein